MHPITLRRGTLSVLAAVSIACGGGSSGSGGSTGAFLDGPVAGLDYVGDTYSGTTNGQGQYLYNRGDSVCFFLGASEIGCVDATGMVTPMDLFPGSLPTDTAVNNMVRLLLSLDADQNFENGIDLTNIPPDAELPDADLFSSGFSTAPDVIAFVSAYGPRTDLVASATAEDHFDDTIRDNNVFENRFFDQWLYVQTESYNNVSDVRTLTFNEAAIARIDLEADEFGNLYFTTPSPVDGESCENEGSSRGRARRIALFDDAFDPNRSDYVSGSAYCSFDEPSEVEIEGFIFDEHFNFELFRIDPTVSHSSADLIGEWYAMGGLPTSFLYFDTDTLTEFNASVSARGIVRFEYPYDAENSRIKAENVTEEEDDELDVIVEEVETPVCQIEARMTSDKALIAGTSTCDGEASFFTLIREGGEDQVNF